MPKRTRERRSFTFNGKKRLILKVRGELGEQPPKSLQQVATENRITPGMLSKWCNKDASEIFEMVAAGRGNEAKSRQMSKTGQEIADSAYAYYTINRNVLTAFTPQHLIHWLSRKFPTTFGRNAVGYKYEFLRRWRRHYKLSVRKKSGVTQLLPADSQQRVVEFFKMLGEQYEKRKPKELVFLDETAVLWNPIGDITIAERGAHSVPIFSKDEKKTSTAMLYATAHVEYKDNVPNVNALHGKPWIIFGGVPGCTRVNSVALDAARLSREHDNKVVCKVSASSWINADIFTMFVESLPQHSEDDGAWLVMDTHASHRIENAREILKKKNYTIFYIPGGCTSKLQIHDVFVNKTFNKSVKTSYYDMEQNGHKITREDIVKFVIKGIEDVPVGLLEKGVLKCLLPPEVTGGPQIVISDDDEKDESSESESDDGVEIDEGDAEAQSFSMGSNPPRDTVFGVDYAENFLDEISGLARTGDSPNPDE